MRHLFQKIRQSKYTEPLLIVVVCVLCILQMSLPLGHSYLPLDFVPEEDRWKPVFFCSNIFDALLYILLMLFWAIYLYTYKKNIWLYATFSWSVLVFLLAIMQICFIGNDYIPNVGILISFCFTPMLFLLIKLSAH